MTMKTKDGFSAFQVVATMVEVIVKAEVAGLVEEVYMIDFIYGNTPAVLLHLCMNIINTQNSLIKSDQLKFL